MRNWQSELAPVEDRSSIRFVVTAPEGTSYYYMVNFIDNFANYLYDSIPERDFVFARTPAGPGSNTSQPRLGLIEANLRTRSQADIVNDLQKKLPQFNDVRIFAIQEQTISVGLASRGSLPIQFIIQNQDLNKLKSILPQCLEEVRKDKTFANADVNIKFNKPEVGLTVDRMKVKDLGLTTADVVGAIQAAFSGGRLAYFIMNGYQYQVIAQIDSEGRNNPDDIKNIFLRTKSGNVVPFDAVVHLEENSNPATLYHFNRYKSATISASLAEGKTIGDGINAMQNIANRLLVETYHTA
jgi:HAE1 family hydrophobic/amphiphilic exporter-1/multidrug efflux pump